jgi:hypothetical protein
MSRCRYLVASLVPVAGLAVALTHPPSAASQTPTSSLRVEYDCANVPWSCTGGRYTNRWQLWEAKCDNSGCEWRWDRRIEAGMSIQIAGLQQWRMSFGADEDLTGFEFCRAWLDQDRSRIRLEFLYRCDRFPAGCTGPRYWQIYRCRDCSGDPGSPWQWYDQVAEDCVYHHLSLEEGWRYMLHWGEPRELEVKLTETPTPQPSATPTLTPAATSTGTPPPTIAATPSATATSTTPEEHLTWLPAALNAAVIR